MPADEVTHGTSVGESRARSGPRHAAPKKPLLTRLKMPAGKAIALAAMPTAVLMGSGFTPTLARAEDPASQSLTADEYKDCVEALDAAEDGDDATASPTPSPSASESDDTSDNGTSDGDTATDVGTPTDSDTGSGSSDDSASDDTSSDGSSSSDSGTDDKETSDTGESTTEDTAGKEASGATATPSPSATETGGNVLDGVGSALEDLFTPGDKETSPSATPSATASPPAPDDTSGSSGGTDSSDSSKDAKGAADDAADKVEDTAKDVTDTAEDTTDDTADDTADDETASPSPSPSDGVNAEDCPAATDDVSGVEQGIPPLPDDPWYLNASSLLLKGASYKGVVKVKTANGSVKEVLKYVISGGSDIGDLHQTVEDKQAGVTYHVQAGKGTTSTIRDGKTVMYTESISGNLLGLIPVTFDPKHPPPLDIPLIYFTKVKVVQAGQFGGTLTVPGMHQFMTD